MSSPDESSIASLDAQHDKYVGLMLAVSSSLMIGISFVITKKGLIDSTSRHGGHGSASDQYLFLKNPIWLLGMLTMAAGEIANFAAYSFAPAILVTPLGALSVIIGAVLAAFFLHEKLGIVGKVGCALCLIGSVVIVLHAPEEKDITSVDEILNYALQPDTGIKIPYQPTEHPQSKKEKVSTKDDPEAGGLPNYSIDKGNL